MKQVNKLQHAIEKAMHMDNLNQTTRAVIVSALMAVSGAGYGQGVNINTDQSNSGALEYVTHSIDIKDLLDTSIGVSSKEMQTLKNLANSQDDLTRLQKSNKRGAFVRDFYFNFAAQYELGYIDSVIEGSTFTVYDDFVGLAKKFDIQVITEDVLREKIIDNDHVVRYLAAISQSGSVFLKGDTNSKLIAGTYEYSLIEEGYSEQGISISPVGETLNFYDIIKNSGSIQSDQKTTIRDKDESTQVTGAEWNPHDGLYHRKQVVHVVEGLLKNATNGKLSDDQVNRLREYLADRVENGEVLQGYLKDEGKISLYDDLVNKLDDKQSDFRDIMQVKTNSFATNAYYLNKKSRKELKKSDEQREVTWTHDAFMNAVRARYIAGPQDKTYLMGVQDMVKLTSDEFVQLANGNEELAKSYQDNLFDDLKTFKPQNGVFYVGSFHEADEGLFARFIESIAANKHIVRVDVDLSKLSAKLEQHNVQQKEELITVEPYFKKISKLLRAGKHVVFLGNGSGSGLNWDKDGDPTSSYLIDSALKHSAQNGLATFYAPHYPADELQSIFACAKTRALDFGGFVKSTMNIKEVRDSFSDLAKNNSEGIDLHFSSMRVVDDEFVFALLESFNDKSTIYLPCIFLDDVSPTLRELVSDATRNKLKRGPRILLGENAKKGRSSLCKKNQREEK